MTEPRFREVLRVFWLTLWLNLLVAGGKLTVGYLTGTLSLIADGFHSVLDASANVAGIVSMKFAMQPPDRDHPYGHRKFEAFGSMIISFFLFFASFNVLQSAIARLLDPAAHMPTVSWVSYGVIVVSLFISLFVSRYEAKKGRELENDLLIADSKHTMSDVYNSISVLVALVAIQLNFPWVDMAVALVIVAFIFKAGFGIIMTHLGALVDEVVLDPKDVEKLVMEVPGVVGCHKIRSRGMKNNVFIDLHIQVDPDITVREGHGIAYAVEDKLKAIPSVHVADVLVHIEDARRQPG